MSGKRISETALSISVPSGMTAKRRKAGHFDPPGGPPTIVDLFEIPEIVERVLSYLEHPRDIERAAMANKLFGNTAGGLPRIYLSDLILQERFLGRFRDSKGTGSIQIWWTIFQFCGINAVT